MLSPHCLLPSLFRTASAPYKFCLRCISSVVKPEAIPSEPLQELSSSKVLTRDAGAAESPKLNFRAMQQMRHDQAHESLLIQAPGLDAAAVIEKECAKFGSIQSMFHYRQQEKDYFLVHMNDSSAVGSLMDACSHPAREGIIPVRSRLLDASTLRVKGTGTSRTKLILEQTITQGKLEDDLQEKTGVSAQMQHLYESCRMPEIGTRLRYFIASQIEDTVSGLFPHCRVYLFGSSVNGFGQHHSDVDFILDFDTAFTEKKPANAGLRFITKPSAGNDRVQCQRSLELLADNLQYLLPGYSQVQRILLARVPIVKFLHDVSGVRCDLSITNMSGLVMSNYLYTLGEIDERLRILVVTIRRWAEANRLTSAHPGRWITNFTLTILAVFFMQHKKLLPPLAQLSSSPITPISPSDQHSADLGQLLGEFFAFYASFNYKSHAISVIDGTTYPKPDFASLYIENPLETELNISRNLSAEELDRVVTAMRGAVWILEGAEKDSKTPGILRLFQEFSEKDTPGMKKLKMGAVNVGELFSTAGDIKKYQPDEFTVETNGKSSPVPKGGSMTQEERHHIRTARQKFSKEKLRPSWSRW